MTIMGLLQCTWAHEPERVDKWFARDPERRNKKIATLLFGSRCLTGRRLREAFGPLCDDIIWENATPVIAGQASGCPPGDPKHVQAALERIKPDVVLAFGGVADNALSCVVRALNPRTIIISGPHPASRRKDTPQQLEDMRRLLDEKTKE